MDSHARPESRVGAFLNYDVRQVMYDFMKPDLPPFGSDNAYVGYALSCTSAHHDIRTVSCKSYAKYTRALETEFFSKTGFACRIPQAMKDTVRPHFMSLIIEIPVVFINTIASQLCTDEAIINIFSIFYPVFVLPFDSVTMSFKDSPGSRSLSHNKYRLAPKDDSFGFLAMQELVRTINNATCRNQSQFDPMFRNVPCNRQSIRASRNGLLGDLISPVRGDVSFRVDHAELSTAKRITIAYDFRKPENQGETIRSYPYDVRDRQIDARSMQGQYGYSIHDRICSENGLVGEDRFTNNHNWALTSPEELGTALHAPNQRIVFEPPASARYKTLVSIGFIGFTSSSRWLLDQF